MLSTLPPEPLLEISHFLPLQDLTSLLATSQALSSTLQLASPNRLLRPRPTSTILHAATQYPTLLRTLPLHDSPKDTKTGFTPLHTAALTGALESVRILLTQGVNPDVTCAQGFTALETAARESHADIVEVLLGASTKARRAAELAAEMGAVNVLDVLARHGVRFGGEVTFAALREGKTGALGLQGVEVDAVDGLGTPAIVAVATEGKAEC